jgi:hypothetical protein
MCGTITIELVGLPGSGKTTLCRPLMRALEKHGWVCDGSERMQRLGSGQWRLLRGLPDVTGILGMQTASLAASRRSRSLFWVGVQQRVVVQVARREGMRFCVFHEGVINQAWRRHFDGKLELSDALLSRFLRFSDVIVMLDVPAETAKERIANKDRDPINYGRINEVLNLAEVSGEKWARALQGCEQIRRALAHRKRSIIFENHEPLLRESVERSVLLSEIAAGLAAEIVSEFPD